MIVSTNRLHRYTRYDPAADLHMLLKEDLWQQYGSNCTENQVSPLSHIAAGRLVQRYYPDIQSCRSGRPSAGEQKHGYLGLFLSDSMRQSTLVKDISDIVAMAPPSFFVMKKDSTTVTLGLNTGYRVNGSPVIKELTFDQDGGRMLLVMGTEVELPGLEQTAAFNTVNLGWIFRLTELFMVCQGYEVGDRAVLQKSWYRIESWTDSENGATPNRRLRAAKCVKVLPFQSRNPHCSQCARSSQNNITKPALASASADVGESQLVN